MKTFRIVSLSLGGLAAAYCALAVPIWVHHGYVPSRVFWGLGFPAAWILLVLPWTIFRKRLKEVSRRWWDQAVPVLSLVFVAIAMFVGSVNPKVAQIAVMWAAQNVQAQDFYGKVVDQYGQPIAGAVVNGDLMFIQGVDEGERKEVYKTDTDTDGEFAFTGLHGWKLAIAPSKTGYDLARNNNAMQLPPVGKTSPTNRAIFTMWKLKGAEPMKKERIHALIPCDGTATMFDLDTGKKVVKGGGLTVRLNRDPVNIVRGKPFGWQLSLEIPGGGFQEIASLYPNEAPAEGYRQVVTVSMPVDSKDWSPEFQKAYYFRTGQLQDYGRININMTADFQPPPTFFEADVFINPAGSRNLEFDPAMQVR